METKDFLSTVYQGIQSYDRCLDATKYGTADRYDEMMLHMLSSDVSDISTVLDKEEYLIFTKTILMRAQDEPFYNELERHVANHLKERYK